MTADSKLVSYVKASPNHSGKRTHTIDTISIHCVAANATIESLGATFANPSRQASSQYGIGTDGRIGQYVPEAYRSWCTGNRANDQRAITIEVSNNGGAPDWPVSTKAYESLIQLLVDICQRNPGIGKLKWQGNKALIGQVSKQNMTVHRWFQNKACVPTNSEVLTKQGWVKLSDIEIGDEIACADLDNLKISFEEVYDKVDERQQDTYTNNGLTATKDHRMVYSTQSAKNKYRIDEYKHLLNGGSNIYIPMAGYVQSDGLPLTDDMIAFYIAVQADGHYMYDTRVSGERHYYGIEFHFKKERKIERIIGILENIHLDYTISNQSNGSKKIRVYNQDETNIVKDICEKYLQNKKFTWEWINLSQEQAKFFLQEIQLWDGCKAGNLYTSSDKINLDVVSAIAALNGVGSCILGTNVKFHQTPFITLGSETKRNKHLGPNTLVSCVSVKTGMFLVRQNGKTFIIGNCPGDYLYNRHAQIAAEVNRRLDQASVVTNVDYNVKVTAHDGLNCRTSPMYGSIITTYPYNTILHISKEQNNWGYTGKGWVSLAYTEKEDDDMTQEQFNEMFKTAMTAYRKTLQDNDAQNWSEEDRQWAVDNGLFEGSGTLPNGEPNYMWDDFANRVQLAALFHRYYEKFNK